MKIKFHRLLILALVVTFFQLLTPNGKILFSIGKFNVTLGALKSGLFKSGILILLQLLSKLIVSLNIRFPGRTGAFLKDVFFIYEKLTDENFISNKKEHLTFDESFSKIPQNKKKLSSFIENLDSKLISIWKQI